VCFVYILRCARNALYVGVTDDLEKRLTEHTRGRGGAFTAARLPVKPVHVESYPDRATAVAREKQLKRWTRTKKEALIAGDASLLKRL